MIKIQKVLASLGLASRREIENWIKAKRIQVNDGPASLGQRITADDIVIVDGDPIDTKAYFQTDLTTQVLIYNKPMGEECSTKPADGRKSVFQHFPKGQRWILVGRLDVNTSGLLLVTNNGELANRLMHPSYQVVRTYRARIDQPLQQDQIKSCLEGIQVDDYEGKFSSLKRLPKKQGRNQWYEVTLQTGRNREVRRIFAAVAVTVSRLMRTAYGPVLLPRDLATKHYRLLTDVDVRQLLSMVGLAPD